MTLLHATAIRVKGCGVILTGKSGSGKSDLALRMIDRGAQLIGDDYVDIEEIDSSLFVKAKTSIAGKIEVRGLGILPMTMVDSAPLRLYVDLEMQPERHPDLWPSTNLEGFAVPSLTLCAFEASASIKLELAVDILIRDAIFPTKVAR
jgi:HPr kinase/phosphorylase